MFKSWIVAPLLVLLSLLPLQAEPAPLPQPAGDVMLTVTGAIGVTNAPEGAEFEPMTRGAHEMRRANVALQAMQKTVSAAFRQRKRLAELGVGRISFGPQVLGLTLQHLATAAAQLTARLALEAGRDVMAIPGSIHNPQARGCHRLIRDGATLVENPDQVIEALEPLAASLAADLRSALGPLQTPAGEPTGTPNGRSAGGQPGDTADHNRLWSALGHDPTPLDELVRRTGLTVAELSSMLLVMELDGLVTAEHGRYQRKTGFFTSTASLTQAEGQ